MKVQDVQIDDDYITVVDSNTILAVAQILAEKGIPDAVVLDKDDKVLGTLDDYLLVTKVMATEKDPSSVTAKDIMLTPPTVTEDTDLEEAEEIMDDLDVTILPVVDENNHLLGVVTIMDVLEGLAKMHEPKGGILSFMRGLF